MRAKPKQSLLSILSAALILGLVVACGSFAYAKGATKSQPGNEGRSQSQSNESRSSQSQRSESRPSQSQREDSRSSQSQSDRSEPSRSTERSSPPPPSESRGVTWGTPSRQDTSGERGSSSMWRSERTSPKQEDRSPGVKVDAGQYRKDYADIGDIWRSRREKRDSNADRMRRDNDRAHNHSYYPYHRSYSFPAFHYRHYCHDYRPGYSYPGLYCYYYYPDLPPYISGTTIVIVQSYRTHRTYVEVPIVVHWDDDYYLSDRREESMRKALTDIRRAWERSDIDLIMDHIRRDSRIAIFLRGEYSYSVGWQDYYEMTRDAIGAIRTRSFSIDRVTRRYDDCVVAYGKHLYVDEDGLVKTVYVSYTLERNGSNWYITEVGSSSYPL